MPLRPAAIALAAALFAAPAFAQQDGHEGHGQGGEMMSRAPEGGAAAMTPAPAINASPDAAMLGDPDAPVEIIEYASVTCPHCADFHATLFPHIKETWIDTGQARLVMRPLPTAPVQLAVAGFLTARCAGPESYFAVLDDLFGTQQELMTAAQTGGEALQAYYDGVAADHGMTPEDLQACFSEQEGVDQINAAIASANAAGVHGTPAFIINGELKDAGMLATEAAWDAAIQAELDGAE